METLTNLIGQKVYLKLLKITPEEILGQMTGIYENWTSDWFSAKIKEVDSLGLWVESFVELEDLKTHTKKKYETIVLLKWQYIGTIVRTPAKEDAPPVKNEMGFKV